MKRFKNILYVMDGKTLAQQDSADKVATLARLNGARVSAIIVDETTLIDDLSLKISGRYAEIKQAILRQNTEDLNRFIRHKRWSDIDISADHSESGSFIAIIHKVLREGHDLVIKEETLDRGIDQLAMRLIRKCPCPVWVVKRDSGDFKRILAAVDVGSDYPETKALNKKIVELAHSLAQREQGEAHYLHVWRLAHEVTLRGPRFNVSSEEIAAMKKKISEESLAQLHSLLDSNHIPRKDDNTHCREGRSEEVIKKSIDELGVDVIVMGSVGRSGVPGLLIGNKAEEILNSINCTVLTVKPDGFISPVTLP
ncbi:universal stress protein [Desulfosediminicola flagellatus]|uniref:universal stress protein n=1 Tax=Desulfosediminicola flagellatus TaxID=2569541 RepID=UPI0010ACC8FD|nr:universal stress protein [Desulfosediminicola flagellatus]